MQPKRLLDYLIFLENLVLRSFSKIFLINWPLTPIPPFRRRKALRKTFTIPLVCCSFLPSGASSPCAAAAAALLVARAPPMDSLVPGRLLEQRIKSSILFADMSKVENTWLESFIPCPVARGAATKSRTTSFTRICSSCCWGRSHSHWGSGLTYRFEAPPRMRECNMAR